MRTGHGCEPREMEGTGPDLGAQHGVADHEAADRDQQREQADVGDVREHILGRRVRSQREQAEEDGRDAGQGERPPSLRGDRNPQRVTESGGGGAHVTSSRNMLSSESSSGRTSSSRAPSDRASCGSAIATSRARLEATTRLDAVDADAAHRVEVEQRGRELRAAVVRTRTRRGRSAIASRMAWWPPAAASRPRRRTI